MHESGPSLEVEGGGRREVAEDECHGDRLGSRRSARAKSAQGKGRLVRQGREDGARRWGIGASNARLRRLVYTWSVIGSLVGIEAREVTGGYGFGEKEQGSVAKIRQEKDGWDPLTVPWRRAEDGTRGPQP